MAQGLRDFLFSPKTGVFWRIIRHDIEQKQVARLLMPAFAPSGHRMQLWNGRLKVFLLARDSS
jgi:hypothetical protein